LRETREVTVKRAVLVAEQAVEARADFALRVSRDPERKRWLLAGPAGGSLCINRVKPKGERRALPNLIDIA
jgi:hypothetical protein